MKKTRIPVDLKTLAFHHTYLAGSLGTEMLYVTHPRYPAPLGYTCYAQRLLNELEILDCFVNELFRGQGICGEMCKWLRLRWPRRRMSTATASGEAKRVLEKLGFVLLPGQGWFWNARNRTEGSKLLPNDP